MSCEGGEGAESCETWHRVCLSNPVSAETLILVLRLWYHIVLAI